MSQFTSQSLYSVDCTVQYSELPVTGSTEGSPPTELSKLSKRLFRRLKPVWLEGLKRLPAQINTALLSSRGEERENVFCLFFSHQMDVVWCLIVLLLSFIMTTESQSWPALSYLHVSTPARNKLVFIFHLSFLLMDESYFSPELKYTSTPKERNNFNLSNISWLILSCK